MKPIKTRPSKPIQKTFAINLIHQKPKLYMVKDGDTWDTLANTFQMAAITLKHFNFATGKLKHLNWYLYNYVGCRTESADGKSYVFSSLDCRQGSGMIAIPQLQIGSVRRSLSESEHTREKELPMFMSKCNMKGMSCLTEVGFEEVIKRYSNTKFVHGKAFLISKHGIMRGQLFKRMEGDRIVLGASSTLVYFLMNDKGYAQNAWDFTHDILMGAFRDAGQNSMGVVYMAKIEMALIMGFASSVSTIGFVAVTSGNICKFVVESDVKGLVKKMMAFYAASKILEITAPTLYERLFSWSTAWTVTKETVKRIPESFTNLTAEDVAQLLGGLIAKLGIAAVETLLKQLLAVTESIVIFIATKLIPKAGEIAVGEYKAMVAELIQALQKLQIKINDADAISIVQELQNNRNKIEPTLNKLLREIS